MNFLGNKNLAKEPAEKYKTETVYKAREELEEATKNRHIQKKRYDDALESNRLFFKR